MFGVHPVLQFSVMKCLALLILILFKKKIKKRRKATSTDMYIALHMGRYQLRPQKGDSLGTVRDVDFDRLIYFTNYGLWIQVY